MTTERVDKINNGTALQYELRFGVAQIKKYIYLCSGHKDYGA